MRVLKLSMILFLGFVLIGSMNCTKTGKPETQPGVGSVPEEQGSSEERAGYTLQLGANETKSVTGTYSDFILATGLTKKAMRLKLIDITSGTPKVIRTETMSAGASFTIRNNFSGATKTIKTEGTNLANAANTVYLTLQ